MRKNIFKLGIAICLVFGILAIHNVVQAAGLKLKNLDYQVNLQEDGVAKVTETWVIQIQDTNTLFKTFQIDKNKYSEITNVKVAEITSEGKRKEFTKINQEKYHVDKNCYYALVNKSGKYEIAWGVHAEDVTKTYKISYEIIDAVSSYQDCSEFYWQFIATESEIPANMVTGTIVLPKEVSQKEDLKVWAHGPLNGTITIEDNKTVSFTIQDLKKNTMLEARVVTPNTIFTKNQNVKQQAKLQSILTQEEQWANEANALRDKIAKQQEERERNFKIMVTVLVIVSIGIAIFIITRIIKYHKILKETVKIMPEQEMQYYRDIPNEKYSPAQASFLYYFPNSLQNNISKVISATMLELCRKGYISFEVEKGKKDKIIVTINEKEENLPSTEKIVYNLLKKVPKKEGNSFTMKEFEKYAQNHASTFLAEYKKIEKEVKQQEEINKTYQEERIKTTYQWQTKGTLYIVLALVSMFFMFFTIIPAVIASVYCFKIASRYHTLTQEGVNEQAKWKGLANYMKEFSLIKDREVPELVLWEKYLVFATAFGIADKVLEQLKVVYPQIADTDFMMSNQYTYLYLMYHANLNHSFVNVLNRSVNNVYTNTTYSSGSGTGGGFSGGGGFGGGGGRNGRKIKQNTQEFFLCILFYHIFYLFLFPKIDKIRKKILMKSKYNCMAP